MFELKRDIIAYGPKRFPVCLPIEEPDFGAGLKAILAGYGPQADNSK